MLVGLQLRNPLPGLLQLEFQGLKAVMNFLALCQHSRLVGLLTLVALHLKILASFLTMVLHILAQQAQTTALSARLHDFFARLDVGSCLLVWQHLRASLVPALKLKLHQVRLHVSIYIVVLYLLVALALLGAVRVVPPPRVDASRAEQRAAASALHRIEHDIGTDRTDEEVGLLLHLWRLFLEVTDVEMSHRLSLAVRNWDIRKAVRVLLLERLRLLDLSRLLLLLNQAASLNGWINGNRLCLVLGHFRGNLNIINWLTG